MHTRKNQGLFGKGLRASQRTASINSLPNDKILDWSKLKDFADDYINVVKEWKFVIGREENIVG